MQSTLCCSFLCSFSDGKRMESASILWRPFCHSEANLRNLVSMFHSVTSWRWKILPKSLLAIYELSGNFFTPIERHFTSNRVLQKEFPHRTFIPAGKTYLRASFISFSCCDFLFHGRDIKIFVITIYVGEL